MNVASGSTRNVTNTATSTAAIWLRISVPMPMPNRVHKPTASTARAIDGHSRPADADGERCPQADSEHRQPDRWPQPVGSVPQVETSNEHDRATGHQRGE